MIIKITSSVILVMLSVNIGFAQSSLAITDSRSTSTTPDSYSQSFTPSFKEGAVIGLTDSYYYTVLGLRGWIDNTGGRSHELAFGDNDQIKVRSGFSPVWDSWRTLVTTNSQGNVGIGTTNPQNRLDVNGTIRWGQSGSYFYSGQDGTGGFIEQSGSSQIQSKLRLQSPKLGDMSSYAQLFIDPHNGFSFMTLGSANGNVGIGTDSPKEKLSVNGKIRAHEIKVETDNWPDYVFERGYEVGTLKALESYIKQHKHLPEIPSAKEVETNGIALGEMNKLLLKKIEELSLHLIEKDKEVKTLQAEMGTVKTLLNQLILQKK